MAQFLRPSPWSLRISKLSEELHRNPRTSPAPETVKKDKKMYENLSEQEIDKTLADSFPASDPPSWH